MSQDSTDSPNAAADAALPPRGNWPLWQLMIARLREFYREPEAVFWGLGFPTVMVIALGIAFRNKPAERITVDVAQDSRAVATVETLKANEKFVVAIRPTDECQLRLRTGKIDAYVATDADGRYAMHFDPTRPESVVARDAVEDALQRAAKRVDPLQIERTPIDETGGRYVDFLVPGLLGMNLMAGGLWGVGFVTVDMRIRKLLKRFLATPMRKSQFLAGIMLSRMLFMAPEVLVLLVFSRLAFGVVNRGSQLSLLLLVVLGAVMFSGIGLLVASRPRTVEAVTGLMNLVMLPMWILSGIFFSAERFPTAIQPLIKILPLSALITSMRAVMLEGRPLWALLPELGIMAAWSCVSFALALRWFRWS